MVFSLFLMMSTMIPNEDMIRMVTIMRVMVMR